MINSIKIEGLNPQIIPENQLKTDEVSKSSFDSILSGVENVIEEVNQDQINADQSVKDFIAGRNKSPHDMMIALEKADISLKTFMQIRNKVLEAYKEIIRMQV